MSTTLFNAYVAFSKAIGDYWAGTTTDAGTATTLVDSSLMGKSNDWVKTGNCHVILAEEPGGSAAIYDERKVTALDNTTGTLTTLTFAAAPGTGIDYYLNRIFSPSEIKLALVRAAPKVFPFLYSKIFDETKVAGNWLKDGSLEYWSSSSALAYWTTDTCTLTQDSTAFEYIHGNYSAKLSGSAGNISQSITNNDDLKYLRGKRVTLKLRGKSDTASSLRAGVYDGLTLTYTDYHAGDSAWDSESSSWYKEVDISPEATAVQVLVYHDNAAAVDIVDDIRLIGPNYPKVYIGNLSLAQDYPRRVSLFSLDGVKDEPIPIREYEIDSEYLYLKSDWRDYRMRIEGYGYLDFLSSGVASTAWTATITLDEPQLQVLIAEAAVSLYSSMAAQYTDGGNKYSIERLSYWALERDRLQYKFQMPTISIRGRRGIQ